MIIRKPTKINLKQEDDLEEYEQYKFDQKKLKKTSKNTDSAFGSDFAISLSANSHILN